MSVLLSHFQIQIGRPVHFNATAREEGRDWPEYAETMIGTKRLNHLQYCVFDIIRNRVPGDLVETGVWRGGACILMRAILKVYGDTSRKVWAADSFQGLPKPNVEKYPADRGTELWSKEGLAVSLEEVKENFRRYGVLDNQVEFLPGWFKDTLPNAPISKIAVLRLDGDMYESTMDSLNALYHKVSSGGYVIFDEYYHLETCRAAVDDYRTAHNIEEPMQQIDWSASFWQKR